MFFRSSPSFHVYPLTTATWLCVCYCFRFYFQWENRKIYELNTHKHGETHNIISRGWNWLQQQAAVAAWHLNVCTQSTQMCIICCFGSSERRRHQIYALSTLLCANRFKAVEWVDGMMCRRRGSSNSNVKRVRFEYLIPSMLYVELWTSVRQYGRQRITTNAAHTKWFAGHQNGNRKLLFRGKIVLCRNRED